MPYKDTEAKRQYMITYRSNPEHKELAKQRCESETYKEYRKTKTTCTCGLEITNHQMSEHRKTKKHSNLLSINSLT